MLENLNNRLSLKDLTLVVPEPQKCPAFDPLVEFNTYDWLSVENAMQQFLKEIYPTPTLYEIAACTKILNLPLWQSFKFKEMLKEKLITSHSIAQRISKWDHLFRRIVNYKILFPEKIADLYPYELDFSRDMKNIYRSQKQTELLNMGDYAIVNFRLKPSFFDEATYTNLKREASAYKISIPKNMFNS